MQIKVILILFVALCGAGTAYLLRPGPAANHAQPAAIAVTTPTVQAIPATAEVLVATEQKSAAFEKGHSRNPYTLIKPLGKDAKIH